MKSRKTQILKAIGIASLASVLFMTPIHAATYTWNGASGSNSNWSTGANWGGSAPPVDANHILAFGGSTRLTPSNDFAAGSSFNSIVFNSGAGAFTLSGNATSLGGAGSILRNDGATAQTVGLAVTATTIGSQLSGAGKIIIGSGGSVSFGANRFNIGTGGASANIELNGGSLSTTYNSTGYSYIGQAATAAANSAAALTVMTGSSLDSSSAIAIGASQTVTNTGVSGSLNVSGGIVDVKNSLGILFGGPFAASNSVDGGTINLSSGTLRVAKITKQQSTTNAAFNFSGGTLAAFDSGNLVVGSPTAANNFAVTLTGSGGIVSSSDKLGVGRTVDIYSVIGQDAAGRGLTFSGTGTTTLRAANTYNGTTTISSGTMVLDTSASIASTALGFGVTDSSNGKLTINNTGYTFSGALSLNINTVTVSSNTWTLFDGSAFGNTDLVFSGVTSDIVGLTFSNIGSGLWRGTDGSSRTWTVDQGLGTLNVIPEPSSLLLLLGAGISLAALRRRRKH